MSTISRPQVTYKGVSAETQEAVRKTARSMGMSIGAWVEKCLQYTAKNPSIIMEGNNYITLFEKINTLETKMEFLMKDYHERRPVAKSTAPLTHTGRIAAGITHDALSQN
jgi:hypothetical protein